MAVTVPIWLLMLLMPFLMQSFQEELLELCGRAHDVRDAYRAIEAVYAAGVSSWGAGGGMCVCMCARDCVYGMEWKWAG